MLKDIKHVYCQDQTYHVSCRINSLSGDIEENPGPSDQCSANTNLAAQGASYASSVSLLETRLSEINRTALDVGEGGRGLIAFFKLYHINCMATLIIFFMCVTLAFSTYCITLYSIESNTDHSWLRYLNNMSCQGTWADAIIIQAVVNCLNLSIRIAESNKTFVPVTVVQPVNVTRACTNIYIGHIIS